MKTDKKKNSNKKHKPTKRLQQMFAISGFYIARDHLEGMGYDTGKVSDFMMKQLASRLGDIMDWTGEEAMGVGYEFDIPKHPEKPSA
jgi:hypothetical protein